MKEFEKWFTEQDFYLNMKYVHGDKLLNKDNGIYRVLVVEMCKLAFYKDKPKVFKDEKTRGWVSEVNS